MLVMHDYMEQTDGGSRLCLELAHGLGAELLCGFIKNNHPYLQDEDLPVLHTLMPKIAMPLLAIPLLRQWLLAQAFYRGFASIQKNHDYIIYSGSYAPLAIHGHVYGVRNILYCHTPPRFLYDGHEAFAKTVIPLMRPLFLAFCQWLRPHYENAANKMDVIIANSLAVQERIQHFLGRDSQLVYPPCNTADYYWEKSHGYFLSMVRLDHMKRVDLLVKAFESIPHLNLVICSDGPDIARLRRLSAHCANIIFTGVLSEKEKRATLAKCTATLCVAREEDFGMCAVESLAAGKPVIIAAAGGLKEIVIDGENGVHLAADPEPEDIAKVVCAMSFKLDNATNALTMRHDCQKQSQAFDLSVFLEKMRRITG